MWRPPTVERRYKGGEQAGEARKHCQEKTKKGTEPQKRRSASGEASGEAVSESDQERHRNQQRGGEQDKFKRTEATQRFATCILSFNGNAPRSKTTGISSVPTLAAALLNLASFSAMLNSPSMLPSVLVLVGSGTSSVSPAVENIAWTAPKFLTLIAASR